MKRFVELTEAELATAVRKLQEFHGRYAALFRTQTRSAAEPARQYLHGQLMCLERGNTTTLEKWVPDSDHQVFQQFLSDSPWLEDGKGEVGMADYEVRGWRGWHHHMTMTLLAMLFLLGLQLEWQSAAPLLTVQDIREILEEMLPKREITPQGILELLERKYQFRERVRGSHHRR